MKNRTLSLKRESLIELSAEDLGVVNGAAYAAPPTVDVKACWGDLFTHHTAVDCLTRICN